MVKMTPQVYITRKRLHLFESLTLHLRNSVYDAPSKLELIRISLNHIYKLSMRLADPKTCKNLLLLRKCLQLILKFKTECYIPQNTTVLFI